MAQINFIPPFCFVPVDPDLVPPLVGSGTHHPLGLTLNELFYFAFKVKSISVNGSSIVGVSTSILNDYNGNINPIDPKDSAGTFGTSETIFQKSNPVSELDLVCNLPSYTYVGNCNISIDFNSIYIYNDLYYPYIVISSKTHTSLFSDISGAISEVNLFYYKPPFMSWPPISYTDNGSNLSIDLFGTSSKTISMYLRGFDFFVYIDSAIGRFVGSPYCDFFYAYDVSQYYGKGYSFSATGQTTIDLRVDSTWPYNP